MCDSKEVTKNRAEPMHETKNTMLSDSWNLCCLAHVNLKQAYNRPFAQIIVVSLSARHEGECFRFLDWGAF